VECAVLQRLKLLRRLQEVQLSPDEAWALLELFTTTNTLLYSVQMYTVKYPYDSWSFYVRSIHHGDEYGGFGRTLR
jgi:hypothetical protein